MNLFKLLLVVAVAGGGYHYWKTHSVALDLAAATSESGFVSIPVPDGMSPHGVVVFAPENCPSDAAQRAYALVSDLGSRGVPVTRADAASFDNLPDAATAERIQTVMNGQVPIVFVNGKAKANPSLEEVVAEYRRKSG